MKDEIFKYLKRISENVWDLSAPHLLYLAPKQSNEYLNVRKSDQYGSGFHEETVELIREHASSILSDLENDLNLIDLGPGFPDKTVPLASFCAAHGISIDYWPVDVNATFLEIASREIKKFARTVTPLNLRFEKTADALTARKMSSSRLVLLGLTFMNFDSPQILKLLKQIAGSDGRILIASELVTSGNSMEDIAKQYQGNEVSDFAFGTLQTLGFSRDQVSYSPQVEKHRVEITFAISGFPPASLENLGMKSGDRIVVAKSHRYELPALIEILDKEFSRVQTFKSKSEKTAIAICGGGR